MEWPLAREGGVHVPFGVRYCNLHVQKTTCTKDIDYFFRVGCRAARATALFRHLELRPCFTLVVRILPEREVGHGVKPRA